MCILGRRSKFNIQNSQFCIKYITVFINADNFKKEKVCTQMESTKAQKTSRVT